MSLQRDVYRIEEICIISYFQTMIVKCFVNKYIVLYIFFLQHIFPARYGVLAIHGNKSGSEKCIQIASGIDQMKVVLTFKAGCANESFISPFRVEVCNPARPYLGPLIMSSQAPPPPPPPPQTHRHTVFWATCMLAFVRCQVSAF